MYEDDKMEQGGVNTNLNSENNNGSYESEQARDNTYSSNPYSYGSGENSQNTFGGYGQANQNSQNTVTYGQGGQNSQSSYTYGSGQQNSYTYGNGNGQQNSYSYGNAGQNQNGYGYGNGNTYNNQSTGRTYGTYQYNTSSVEPEPAKSNKNKTAAIVVAAVAILALLVGGVGASYYTITNKIAQTKVVEEVQQQTENEEQQIAKTETTQPQVQATTVTSETKTVVTDVTAVVSEVMPAMVIIHNNYTQSASYFGYTQTQEATASGSGIIVGQNDAELLIATNYHVIEGADSLEVIFNDDSTVEAAVKGTNADMDLAVIAVSLDDISSNTMSQIKVATLGDSDALSLGEPAIAIGNALGYGQSVTTGVISALNRQVEIEEGNAKEFIQTDAAINPGNSGGALLNVQGEVIGINSNKIGGSTVEGMGYAIPISAAKPIIEQLMNEKTQIKYSDDERGYIGISGVSVTSEVSMVYGLPMGVYIAEVSNGGGAQAAGLQKGDIIVEFDGQEVTSMDDLQKKLQYYPVGDTVSVTVMRQDGSEYTEQTYNVTLGGVASTTSGQDKNPAEDGGSSGKFDGSQSPAMPEDKNSAGQGGH